MTVINTNPHNYLQYDCSPIENITFLNNGSVIEQITDYHIISSLMNDITFKNNYYEDNMVKNNSSEFKENYDKLTISSRTIKIPPTDQNTNTMFNPKNTVDNFIKDCTVIKDGIYFFLN
jgi:hypothetical protein